MRFYIASAGNHAIIRLMVSTTTAGTTYTPVFVAGVLNTSGFSDDGGSSGTALLNAPSDVALDSIGNLYILDNGNHVIRFVSIASGVITTIAGVAPGAAATTTAAVSTGATTTASPTTSASNLALSTPFGVAQKMAIDPAGNIMFADITNNSIRKMLLAVLF